MEKSYVDLLDYFHDEYGAEVKTRKPLVVNQQDQYRIMKKKYPVVFSKYKKSFSKKN